MQLQIEKLVFGGYGLARTDKGVIFVEQVLPGEVVKAEIKEKKGGVPVAFPSEIIKKSSSRRKPRCPYYGICGGCDWQYINYEEQLRIKHDIFIDCLRRIGRINSTPEIELIPSPEWEYRIRAQLKVNVGSASIGFYKKKTNSIVSIDRCPLLDPNINSILEKRERLFPMLPEGLKQIQVISGTDGTVASEPVVLNITQKETDVIVKKAVFKVTGESFFQGNKFLLEKLGAWAGEFISGKFFVDMFGGQGFFSIMLGSNFSGGLLVESVKEQVELAELNFKQNRLSGMSASAVSAENFFNKTCKTFPRIDCLIVDPPRPGLTRHVRKGIAELGPGTILYISCNPSTQARDAGYLINKCQYYLEKAALFDMYPQTHHMETVLLLRRD